MRDIPPGAMPRITVELDRLGQEVSATQYVLNDAEPNSQKELARRLRHIAARANRLAEMIENVAVV